MRQNLFLNILDFRLKPVIYRLRVFEILLAQEINAVWSQHQLGSHRITWFQSVSACIHAQL